MKQYLALTGILALALVGCNPAKQTFKISAENLPAELNGMKAYFYKTNNSEAIFDSVTIENGAFQKVINDVDPTLSSVLIIGQESINYIPEAGEVKVVPVTENDETHLRLEALDANSLNAKATAFINELEEQLTTIKDEYKENVATLDRADLTEEEEAKIEQELESIVDRYVEVKNEIARKFYDENKDNAVGVIAFQKFDIDSDSAWVAEYEKASETIRNNEAIRKSYEKHKSSLETAVGKMYKDVTISDGEGNEVQLSDFLKDGRYLLVDFWASWCGPCRAAMPHLAKINAEHGKNIRVLSIGVWEQSKANNDKAKEDLKMTWETLFDSENMGPQTYGVVGIPTLILIAPNGEILARTHDPEEVDKVIRNRGLYP